MKYNDCGCKKSNLEQGSENMVAYSNYDYNMPMYNMSSCNIPNCNMPVRRHLEPVLVAKIYQQPIIEEIPYSSMTLTLSETVNVSNAYSEMRPMCGDGCMENYTDGYNYPM